MKWFALSGTSSTGKTTLMYEIVACLRELGIEATGVTERVRIMPRFSHTTLMENPSFHFELYKAQLAIEEMIFARDEYEVAVLDRCLVDYHVLADLSFPYEDMTPKVDMQIYMDKFVRVYMPERLPIGSSDKTRPDAAFRDKAYHAFRKIADLSYMRPGQIQVVDGLLRDRCKVVVNDVLDSIGRSDIFRDWYLCDQVGEAARIIIADVMDFRPEQLRFFVSGTHSRKSPTLPAYNSDIDLWFEVSETDSSYNKFLGWVNREAAEAVENQLWRLFGIKVHLMYVKRDVRKLSGLYTEVAK